MKTGYELLLPEGLLTYFDVTDSKSTTDSISIYLDEKDLSTEERNGKRLEEWYRSHLSGFYEWDQREHADMKLKVEKGLLSL